MSKIPTLDEFLARKQDWPKSAYVTYPDFASLYVRDMLCYVNDRKIQCLVLASMVAKKPGTGAFKRLVAKYHETHNLYVENVLTPRFCEGLVRMGFKPVKDSDPPCFFMRRKKGKTPKEINHGD